MFVLVVQYVLGTTLSFTHIFNICYNIAPIVCKICCLVVAINDK